MFNPGALMISLTWLVRLDGIVHLPFIVKLLIVNFNNLYKVWTVFESFDLEGVSIFWNYSWVSHTVNHKVVW